MRRRRLLGLAGTTIAAGLAGCPGEDAPATTDTRAPEDPPGTSAESTATLAGGPPRSTTAAGGTPTGTAESTTVEAWPSGPYSDYETTTVRVESPEGERRGAVTAAIADDADARFLGLSDAASMPEDGGMLFVYTAVRDRTFVMRRMDFGLDIVYADDAGTITSIRHAPAPGPNEDGDEQRYPGTGQYVLELNYGWTDRHGVAVGDRLAFDL